MCTALVFIPFTMDQNRIDGNKIYWCVVFLRIYECSTYIVGRSTLRRTAGSAAQSNMGDGARRIHWACRLLQPSQWCMDHQIWWKVNKLVCNTERKRLILEWIASFFSMWSSLEIPKSYYGAAASSSESRVKEDAFEFKANLLPCKSLDPSPLVIVILISAWDNNATGRTLWTDLLRSRNCNSCNEHDWNRSPFAFGRTIPTGYMLRAWGQFWSKLLFIWLRISVLLWSVVRKTFRIEKKWKMIKYYPSDPCIDGVTQITIQPIMRIIFTSGCWNYDWSSAMLAHVWISLA